MALLPTNQGLVNGPVLKAGMGQSEVLARGKKGWKKKKSRVYTWIDRGKEGTASFPYTGISGLMRQDLMFFLLGRHI